MADIQHKDYQKRFEAKFIINPLNGCWEWTGCLDKYGYGHFSIKNYSIVASRVSWMLYKNQNIDKICMPIRLLPMYTTNSRMLPFMLIQFIVGWSRYLAADSKQGAESVIGVESPVHADTLWRTVRDTSCGLMPRLFAIAVCVSPFALRSNISCTLSGDRIRFVPRCLDTISAVLSDFVPSNKWERRTQRRLSQ